MSEHLLKTAPRIKSGDTRKTRRQRAIIRYVAGQIGPVALARELGTDQRIVYIAACVEMKRMFKEGILVEREVKRI